MKYIIIYLVLINLISAILFYIDKKRAIKHQERISERTFFSLSILGSSPSIYLSMYIFHHKTKKFQFKIGIPFIIIIQLIIITSIYF